MGLEDKRRPRVLMLPPPASPPRVCAGFAFAELNAFKVRREDSGILVERAKIFVICHERTPHAGLRALDRADATILVPRCWAWTAGDRILQTAERLKRIRRASAHASITGVFSGLR